jgi:hypothetical protein
MRTIDMIKAKVEAETEAMGYVMAAVLQHRPESPEALKNLLNQLRLNVKGRHCSGPLDHQIFYAATAMLVGIKAFTDDLSALHQNGQAAPETLPGLVNAHQAAMSASSESGVP